LDNVNFGLFKNFTVKEKLRIQFRMTAANILNVVNLGNPNTDFSTGSFGKITSQAGKRDTLGGGPRQILLGLRLEF